MSRRIMRSAAGARGLVALAVLFAAITILAASALRGWRLDLTQDRLYTTSKGTDHILKDLKQPIDLWLFYSARAASQYPQLAGHASRVRDLLQEYAARSNGRLRLHFVDPQPFSEDEDRATQLGINPLNGGNGGGDNPLYFGLAGSNSRGEHAAIGFLDPAKDGLLEYDLSRLIYQLSDAKKPVIGWLTDLPMTAGFDPMNGRPHVPWIAFEQAQQLLDVRVLDDRTTRLDPAINVLVLAHPAHLSPATQFAIDQFALRGGHILAFVDPLADQDSGGADPGNPAALASADRASHLEGLLSVWGVAFDPKHVVADARYALSVTTNAGPVRHLALLGLDQAAMAAKDPVTGGLSTINLATAGHLERVAGAGVTFTPLLQSSDQAALLPTTQLAALTDPASLFTGFKPTGQRYTLAARVTGSVKSAFPGGLPPDAQLPPGQTLLSASSKPLELIVVADSDVLSDFVWARSQELGGQRIAQPFASNGDLLLNALDNLAGSDDLIGIQGRATWQRPFTRIDALRARADERLRAKEQELEKQLQGTEDRLSQLQSQRDDKGAAVLSADQQQELQRFQGEKLRIRKELRSVRLGLDQDITRLQGWLKFLNIVLVPVLLAVATVLIGLALRRRPPAVK